jgi:hypothetical protein
MKGGSEFYTSNVSFAKKDTRDLTYVLGVRHEK